MSFRIAIRRLASFVVVVVALAGISAGGVIVVTPSTPGALQTALDAAVDGDTLLIGPGQYSDCSVSHKALTLIVDPPAVASVEGLHVSGVPAGKQFSVSGLDVYRTPQSINLPTRVLSFDGCAGSVRLQSVRCQLSVNNFSPGLALSSCQDVALVHCWFQGSSQAQNDPSGFTSGFSQPGLVCSASRVALYQCEVTGGNGRNGFFEAAFPTPHFYGPTAGASALVVDAPTQCFAHGCDFRGGQGGSGLYRGCSQAGTPIPGQDGAPGGHGCDNSAGGGLSVLACTSVGNGGGAGGAAGPCGAPGGMHGAAGQPFVGPFVTVADTDAELIAPTHARAGEVVPLGIRARSGDLAMIAFSSQTRWEEALPFHGVLLFGPAVRRKVLGVVGGSGNLFSDFGPLALPPGTLAAQRWIQLLVRHTDGQVELGSPWFLTILDPSF